MVNCREDPQLRCTPKTDIVHTLSLYLSTYTLSLFLYIHTPSLYLSTYTHTLSLYLYLSTYAPPLSVSLQSTYTLSLCLYILSLSLYLSQYTCCSQLCFIIIFCLFLLTCFFGHFVICSVFIYIFIYYQKSKTLIVWAGET